MQVAAPVLGYMYSKCTSTSEKSMLQQEFYGDMYKQDKESNVNSVVRIRTGMTNPYCVYMVFRYS
jgi:hypothetical protein